MLGRLVQFALTQRVLVSLLAVLLAAGGYLAFRGLPIDAFPDVSPTQVKIIVKAPGMTPEEVETRITAPIEVELLGIPDQVMLRSVAKYALTDITVDFADGTDIYWARQQVAERLAGVWENLPPDIEGGIAPMTTPLGEMFMFTVDGAGSLTERRRLLDWVIRPALRTVPGVADVRRVEGVVSVGRERGQRFTVVRSNVSGRDLVGFVDEARAAVRDGVDLPPGYYVEWGGQFENQQRAAARLGIVVPVAIGLIFLLLFSTFRSVRQALLVLTNVPFAMIGGVFALLVTGEYLSVPASVGFIALLGIAVLNGVVLVSYFNDLRERGLPLERVVVEGAMRRLRPVLMTASIAAFGLVPLLFATGPGSEIQRPLAVVVIGGLISATALTLVLLPILYRRFGAEAG